MLVGARAASASPREARRLPRRARLRRRDEFQRVYSQGFRSTGPHMAVFAVVRVPADGAGARLGVTASRKVGNAVVRARCKRRLRELFRTEDRDFAGCDVDVVINARRGCAAAPWAALAREYRRHQAKVTERLRAG